MPEVGKRYRGRTGGRGGSVRRGGGGRRGTGRVVLIVVVRRIGILHNLQTRPRREIYRYVQTCRRERGGNLPAEAGAGLEHQNIHDDFRLGLVQIADDSLRQRDAIRLAAHDDRVLRVVRHDPIELGERPDSVDYLLDFLRRIDVGQIEDLHDLVFVVAALVDVVVGN